MPPPGGYAGGKIAYNRIPSSGGLLVTWLEDMALRDLDDSAVIEATCQRCLHMWLQSPIQLFAEGRSPRR